MLVLLALLLRPQVFAGIEALLDRGYEALETAIDRHHQLGVRPPVVAVAPDG